MNKSLISIIGAGLIASGCDILKEDYTFMEINNKPLILDHFDPEEDATDNKEVYESFLEIYNNAGRNWDRFNEQFERISSIRIVSDLGEEDNYAGRTIEKRKIKLKSILEHVLIHEMAHVWHFTLRNRESFEDEWLDKIKPRYNFRACRGNRDIELCNYLTIRSASVTNYGASNLDEDIAETVELVYFLAHPNYNVPGFPNAHPIFRRKNSNSIDTRPEMTITGENIPRIENKIQLLNKYGFISQRERDYAISELREFEE